MRSLPLFLVAGVRRHQEHVAVFLSDIVTVWSVASFGELAIDRRADRLEAERQAPVHLTLRVDCPRAYLVRMSNGSASDVVPV